MNEWMSEWMNEFAISSQAPTIWNDIPLTIRNSLTISNFKKKLKSYFLSLNLTFELVY